MKPILTGLALVATLYTLPVHAVTTGFSAGNDFTATVLEGELQVQCYEGGASDFGYFRCKEQVLDPAEYSFFVTEPGDNADTVTLKSTWENGKVVQKTERFDRSTGRSKSSFNLWIVTLFQRPLLDIGKNQVQFTLLKDGNSVRQGEFTATIQEGPTRVCRNGYVTSPRLDDCRNPHQACANYFRRENYCQ